jgi:hypothetical protein
MGASGENSTTGFSLIQSDWECGLIGNAAEAGSVKIMCPFIKRAVIERLIGKSAPHSIQVLTRFNLEDFLGGVSDVSVLRYLLEKGAQVRAVQGLHSKLYLFGEARAVVASANLTESAFFRNLELGILCTDKDVVNQCHEYFNEVWDNAKNNLSWELLELIEGQLKTVRESLPVLITREKLPDFGVRILRSPLTDLSSLTKNEYQIRFWDILLQISRERSNLGIASVPGARRHTQFSAGISNVRYCFVVNRSDASIELIITRKVPEENRRALALLESRKEQIEKDFGDKLRWGLIGTLPSAQIVKNYNIGGYDGNDAEVEHLATVMVDDMVLLKAALDKHIGDLDLV